MSCHKTAADVLDTMSKQISGSNQRAFTWTGPFGGGKSSLAVALASALGPDESLRDKAREVLRLSSHPNFDEAFPVNKGWLVLPVVGKRGFVSDEISKTLQSRARLNGVSRFRHRSHRGTVRGGLG